MAKKNYVKVTGLVETRMRVARMLGRVKNETPLMLIKSARRVKRRADTVYPRIPKDTGKLEKSWEIILHNPKSDTPIVEAGFTADHALYVHEMPDSNNFTRPGSGPKYLETHLKHEQGVMQFYIANEVRVIIETTK